MQNTSIAWKKVAFLLVFCSVVLWTVLAFKPENLRSLVSPLHSTDDHVVAEQRPPVLTKPKQCYDPYREPGYLYIPPDRYNETQWIPFDDTFHDLPDPEFATYPDKSPMGVQFDYSGPAETYLNASSMPRQWMKLLLTEHARFVDPQSESFRDDYEVEKSEDISWVQGRRILLIGDSVDRAMMQAFCDEFTFPSSDLNPVWNETKKRTTVTCHLPTLNLTIEHWHFPGTTNTSPRPEWWWMNDMKFVPFEERWKEIWHADTAPTPDLILWQTALWDQRAFWESGLAWEKKNQGDGNSKHRRTGDSDSLANRTRQLTWQELRFFASRLPKFIAMLQGRFGLDEQRVVPLMYRATTLRSTTNGTDSMLYNLDRVSRSHAARTGSEIFEWGRICSDLEWLYKDNTHLGRGAASWLWGNMVLEYLNRVVSGEWARCHNDFLAWGGR